MQLKYVQSEILIVIEDGDEISDAFKEQLRQIPFYSIRLGQRPLRIFCPASKHKSFWAALADSIYRLDGFNRDDVLMTSPNQHCINYFNVYPYLKFKTELRSDG